jgi:hypothetical protein
MTLDVHTLGVWLGPLADELIPHASGMPSASEAGAITEGLEGVVRADPDLLPQLAEAHRLTTSLGPTQALESLSRQREDLLTAVRLTVATAYYSRPEVRRLLGYDGQLPVPVPLGDYRDYIEDGLLDPVLERGELVRRVP